MIKDIAILTLQSIHSYFHVLPFNLSDLLRLELLEVLQDFYGDIFFQKGNSIYLTEMRIT